MSSVAGIWLIHQVQSETSAYFLKCYFDHSCSVFGVCESTSRSTHLLNRKKIRTLDNTVCKILSSVHVFGAKVEEVSLNMKNLLNVNVDSCLLELHHSLLLLYNELS